MTDKHDKDQRAHGETGDTVQQAAEVSKPTSPMGNAADHSGVVPAPPDSTTGAGAGSSTTPGQGNAR